MTLSHETLLDLARQRLRDIAGSPTRTRAARHEALALQREVEAELASLTARRPLEARCA